MRVMESNKTPHGLLNALTTPFNRNNSIDEGAYSEHLKWLYKHGIHQVLVAGTTGEFFSLTKEEKKRLLQLSAKYFNGHIMFHAGSGALRDTIDLAIFAASEGAHSVASILPYFLSSAQPKGLVQYLTQISNACPLPFVIYNFPKHTQVGITAQILNEVPHFGLKDSSADMSLIPHTPNYFIGSDLKLLEAYRLGASGFISARSNAHPKLYSDMDATAQNGTDDKKKETHKRVCDVCATLSGPNQIQLVKEAIQKKISGYPTAVRLPLL